MNTVKIGNIVLGEGTPKICLPIIGKTLKEIFAQAQEIMQNPVDIIEWRADWFEGLKDYNATCEVIDTLRGLIGITPLLYTIRTKKEGGEADITFREYSSLLLKAAGNPNVDAVDVEILSSTEAEVQNVIAALKQTTIVIASSHDFEKTPGKAEITDRLGMMQRLGANVCKMAVMPQSINDVLTLLDATAASQQSLDCPIITMSMGKLGLISRLAGEVFGSSLTFGCVGQASAPGQIDVGELAQVLAIIHKNS